MSQNSFSIASLSHISPRRRQQNVPLWVYAFCILGPPLGLFLATVVVGIAPDRILKDPAGHINFPVYIGFFSNMGILAWWTAAASCVTAAAVLRGRGEAAWQPLAMGGILSAMLCMDDFMLLHEEVLPTYFGVPELLTLAVYGGATVLYLWRFRRFHRDMDTPLLLVALGLFGASVVVDLVDVVNGWWGLMLEDGSKFTGIIVWATYHARSACRALDAAMRG